MPVRETVTIRFDADLGDFPRVTQQVINDLNRIEREITQLNRRTVRPSTQQTDIGNDILRRQRAQTRALEQSLVAQRAAMQQLTSAQRSLGQQQVQTQRQVGQQRVEAQRQSGRQQLEAQRQTGRQQVLAQRQVGQQRVEAQRQSGRQRLQDARIIARREIDLIREQGRQARFEQQRADRLAAAASRRSSRRFSFLAGAFSPSLLLGGLGAFSVAHITRETFQMADAWTLAANRIQNFTDSAAELEEVQEGLFESSQATRTSFEATAILYQRVAQANDSLGVSQDRLQRFVETLNQAFIVSGANAQESRNAIIQFSQGLASGELRGEEFRSVTEQGVRVIQALATALGVTRGELREMAHQGQLTSEVVFGAIESQAATIQQEFDNLTPTISQASTVLNNSVTRMVGNFSEASGAAESLATTIIGIARAIDEVDTTGMAEDIQGVNSDLRETLELYGNILEGAGNLSPFDFGGDVDRIVEGGRAFQRLFVDPLLRSSEAALLLLEQGLNPSAARQRRGIQEPSDEQLEGPRHLLEEETFLRETYVRALSNQTGEELHLLNLRQRLNLELSESEQQQIEQAQPSLEQPIAEVQLAETARLIEEERAIRQAYIRGLDEQTSKELRTLSSRLQANEELTAIERQTLHAYRRGLTEAEANRQTDYQTALDAEINRAIEGIRIDPPELDLDFEFFDAEIIRALQENAERIGQNLQESTEEALGNLRFTLDSQGPNEVLANETQRALSALRLDIEQAIRTTELFSPELVNQAMEDYVRLALTQLTDGVQLDIGRLPTEEITRLYEQLSALTPQQFQAVGTEYQAAQDRYAREQARNVEITRQAEQALQGFNQTLADVLLGFTSFEEGFQSFFRNLARNVLTDLLNQATSGLVSSISGGQSSGGQAASPLQQVVPLIGQALQSGGAGKRTAPVLEYNQTIIGSADPATTAAAGRQGVQEGFREALNSARGQELLRQAEEERE